MLRVHATGDQFAAYLDSTERGVRDDLKTLTDSFYAHLAGVRIEVRKGFPEEVIPEFVVSEGIDLVVMALTLGARSYGPPS